MPLFLLSPSLSLPSPPLAGGERLLEGERPSQAKSGAQKNASILGAAHPQAQSSLSVRRH